MKLLLRKITTTKKNIYRMLKTIFGLSLRFKKCFEVLKVCENVLKNVKNALEYVLFQSFSELIDRPVRCQ